MIPLMDGSRDRIERQTSMPLPSGSRASSTATCGRSAGMIRSASLAEPLSPTTTRSSSDSNRSRRPWRTISWSSSRKIRVRGSCSDGCSRDDPAGHVLGGDREEQGAGTGRPGERLLVRRRPGSSSGLRPAWTMPAHQHAPAGAGHVELVHLERNPADVRGARPGPRTERSGRRSSRPSARRSPAGSEDRPASSSRPDRWCGPTRVRHSVAGSEVNRRAVHQVDIAQASRTDRCQVQSRISGRSSRCSTM